MKPYIEDYKTSFLPWRGGAYAKHGWEFCLGSKKDCERFIEDGAVNLPWDTTPDRKDYERIKALRLIPSPRQLRNSTIPSFVTDLVNLEFLAMPLPFVVHIKPKAIPDSLNSLLLINSKECAEIIKKTRLSWPDVTLPNLRALQFFDSGGAEPIDSLLGISDNTLPSLQYLECGIAKAKQRLDNIADLRKLKFLAIEYVVNHNIFDFIKSPPSALSIVDAANKFPIASMTRIKSLELLWLNNLKCGLDCTIFESLPHLKEINVLNTRNIVNVEALLKCKNLESIQFISCGKPFSKETKQLFLDKHYKQLAIDFA